MHFLRVKETEDPIEIYWINLQLSQTENTIPRQITEVKQQ